MANRNMLSVEYNKQLEKARKLYKAIANVGIIALVDEATGYQDFRDKNALQTILGKYTSNLVYSRLAPGVLAELEKKNPALGEHPHTLITLMRMSDSWEQFYRYVTKAFPVYGEQLNLDLEE